MRHLHVAGARRLSAAVLLEIALGHPARTADGDDLVERRHLMARADVAGINFVVVEILLAQGAVLIADQTIFADEGGVELDLDLHVMGDREEGRGQFGVEHPPGLSGAVDIGVIAVPAIGDLLIIASL